MEIPLQFILFQCCCHNDDIEVCAMRCFMEHSYAHVCASVACQIYWHLDVYGATYTLNPPQRLERSVRHSLYYIHLYFATPPRPGQKHFIKYLHLYTRMIIVA